MTDFALLANRPILVVEDSEEDLDTVMEVAKRLNLPNRIVHAPDTEAAQHLLSGDRSGPFSLVLLDQNLPGTDGCTFLNDLRKDPKYRRLVVVMYSTSNSPRDRDACYQAGANAYHVKSIHFDESIKTLGDIFTYWLRSASLPDASTGGAQTKRFLS